MFEDFNKILVLSPHTDDAELGCGGTIAKLVNLGRDVYWAVFSKAYVPETFSSNSDIVLKEMKESADIIGIKDENIFNYNFSVRRFSEQRQEILNRMTELKKKINPDLIFMPTLSDIHQDHSVVAREGLRVFKNITILGYENPWNHLNFDTTCFVFLSESEIDKKAKAVEKYKSQSHRGYVNERFAKSLARVRGIQIGTSEAEAFEVLRLVFRNENN